MAGKTGANVHRMEIATYDRARMGGGPAADEELLRDGLGQARQNLLGAAGAHVHGRDHDTHADG